MTNSIVIATIVLVVLIIGLLFVSIFSEIKKSFLKYEDFKASVKVIEKYHMPSYTRVSYVGMWKTSTPIPHYHPEEFNVKVQWKDHRKECWTDTIDNKEIFDSVKVNDIIVLRIHVGRNKAGVVKNVYITAE